MSVIDLSQIAAPDIVESLNVKSTFTDMKNDLRQYDKALSDGLGDSAPAFKVLRVPAYREMVLLFGRQKNYTTMLNI